MMNRLNTDFTDAWERSKKNTIAPKKVKKVKTKDHSNILSYVTLLLTLTVFICISNADQINLVALWLSGIAFIGSVIDFVYSVYKKDE